jgi:CHC2 zinc finger
VPARCQEDPTTASATKQKEPLGPREVEPAAQERNRVNSNIGHFRRELLPPPHLVYERELGRLRPAGRDRAIGNCPFHKSSSGRSFSVDLANGLWYCHGCGFGGDIVNFVMRRDGCSFKTACQTLGAWRGDVTANERVEIARREQEREWHRRRETEQKEAERRERLQIRNELHATVRIYYDLDSLLHELGPVGSEADSCWSALPPTLDCRRLEESAYCDAAKLEDPFYE